MKPTRRINGHGLVLCMACKRWVDRDEYGYPPSLKGKPTSYCRACCREIDRMRWRGDRREKANADRVAAKRREQQGRRAEQGSLVRGAILTIRRRGLTKSEIVRLVDTSFTSLLNWERGEQTPTTQIVERFIALLRETSYLPLGDEPEFRRRLPHPDFEMLMERMQPKVIAFPVRSRWKVAA